MSRAAAAHPSPAGRTVPRPFDDPRFSVPFRTADTAF